MPKWDLCLRIKPKPKPKLISTHNNDPYSDSDLLLSCSDKQDPLASIEYCYHQIHASHISILSDSCLTSWLRIDWACNSRRGEKHKIPSSELCSHNIFW